MTDLHAYKLGELLSVTRGTSLPGVNYATSGNLIRLTLGNFAEQGGWKDNTSKENLYYVGQVDPRFILSKGDIITPLTEQTPGLLGSTALVPDDGKYIQSQDIGLVRCKPSLLDKDFAYYLISSPLVKKQLAAASQQTKIRHTSPDKIEECMVYIPSLEYQKKAGSFLKMVDEKIDTNKKIINTLSKTARTIYDYWFLQFEFPNEEGKPYKSSGGKMVWNEELERNIPEGWKSGRISDLGNIVGGGTPSTTHSEYYTKQGIAWMTPKDFAGSNNIFVSHGGRDITEDGLRNSSATLMPQGTVLMSSRAPIGYLGIASNELCTNQGFKSIVPTKSYCSEFIFFTLHTIMPYIKQFGTGSTFSEVSAGEFASVKVLLPHTKISNAFGEKISSIFAMIKNLEEENQRLSSLRDFLLPLLMNGQVLIG